MHMSTTSSCWWFGGTMISMLGRCNISSTVFFIKEIGCPCTIKLIFSRVYYVMPCSHSFTNGRIGVSHMLRKLKTPTCFAQWKSLPFTHLSNLSILVNITLPFPLKVSSNMHFFFSPSTSQSSFGWELSKAFPRSFHTLSISCCSLANLFASFSLIAPLILVLDVIVLRSEMQNNSIIIVEMIVWSPFISVRRDERDTLVGKRLGWKNGRLGTRTFALVLGQNGSS